jgi:gamma-glutamyltranspeptidase
MKFSYTARREWNNYAQRSAAMGPRGMVTSSQQLATVTGYRVLSKGGNSVQVTRLT